MIEWNQQPLINEVSRIANQELQREGVMGVREIRNSFTRGKSRPGQPPAVVSGRLRRDVTFEMRGPTKLLIGVQASNPYALAQELGYPSRGLRPRPYLRPQTPRSVKRINKNLRKRLS